MSDKTRTCDPTWAVVPEPDRPGDVPCLCRGEGGVEPHWREDSQLWHLRIGGTVYGVSRRARDVIAGALGLVDPEGAVPEGVEWPMVDSEPVVPGDVLWDEHGERVTVDVIRCAVNSTKASCYVGAIDEGGTLRSIYDIDGCTRTEPPKPVLDRDGVPIEAGDTVYSSVEGDELYGDEPLEVVRVNTDPDDYKPVEVRTKERYSFRYSSHHLTHERPDSWERLREDVRAFRMADEACGYLGRESWECVGCPFKEDSNCYVAAAEDIVRRAKALAGVVGDE